MTKSPDVTDSASAGAASSPSPPSAPIVRVDGVVKSFGGVRALDGVSLAFEPGIIYALLGPNGAGKTTLIRVLTTLLIPDAGGVEVAGVDVVANPTDARARIGLAGQFAALDDYQTGRENVEMVGRLYGLGGREARRRTREVLEGIGMTDSADRRVGTYSGGMRRRLDLAASLVGRPQVMFLDEPTTGVDPRNRLALWKLVEELVADGTTVLLTSQYLEEAERLATRIGVIDEGRIVTEGTADELKDAVGGAVVEVTVAEEDRETALKVIAASTGEEPTFDSARDHIRVPAPGGSQTLIAVVRDLDDAGLVPVDVGLHKPTLDDVFLTLTDHAPGESGAGNPEAQLDGRVR